MFEKLYGEKAKFMLMADGTFFSTFKIKFLSKSIQFEAFHIKLSIKHFILHF